MKFITVQGRNNSPVYINLKMIIAVVPRDHGADIVTTGGNGLGGGTFGVTNTVAEVFERMQQTLEYAETYGDPLVLDSANAADVDLEGV